MPGLLKAQIGLLLTIVDAHEKVDRSRRGEFRWMYVIGNDARPVIVHEGLPRDFRAEFGDLEELARHGLIRLTHDGRHSGNFRVTNEAIELARVEARANAESVEAVEMVPRSYIRSDAFSGKYQAAHAKWMEADRLLWGAGGEAHLSTVGHLCRESMQAFAARLCELTSSSPPTADPAHTVARIRSCIAARRAVLGDAVSAFLDAGLMYWGTVNDLVQRQEHGGAKGGHPLTLEDGRRVVFHTAIVMYELDRALTT